MSGCYRVRCECYDYLCTFATFRSENNARLTIPKSTLDALANQLAREHARGWYRRTWSANEDRPDRSDVRPYVRSGNDISLRLERRGVVVSALALCLRCNSNDVYRSCYRGYTLSFSLSLSVFLSYSRSFFFFPEDATGRRKYQARALIRLGGTLPRDDKELHSPPPAGVQSAFCRVYLSTGEIVPG